MSEHEPDVWRAARGLLFAKDYLRWWLTGERSTDYIDAEGSLLLNAATHEWDPRLCTAVPIDPGWLPPVLAPSEPAGHVREFVAASTGLRAGTPVMAGCSDTAAVALACVQILMKADPNSRIEDGEVVRADTTLLPRRSPGSRPPACSSGSGRSRRAGTPRPQPGRRRRSDLRARPAPSAGGRGRACDRPSASDPVSPAAAPGSRGHARTCASRHGSDHRSDRATPATGSDNPNGRTGTAPPGREPAAPAHMRSTRVDRHTRSRVPHDPRARH